jgi:curved DNA-binding protein
MADPRDYYEVLGVPRTASQKDIQRAYRKLARTHHPDVNKDPAAEERFKEISAANDVLSDPEDRRRYDSFGPDFRQVPKDVDPETWARAQRARAAQAAGGGARGSRGGRAGGRAATADDGWYSPGGRGTDGPGVDFGDVDLEDLFGDLFGSGYGSAGRGGARGRSRGWGPVAGADQEAVLEVSVEEAYRGGRRSLTIGGPGSQRTLDVTIPAGVTDGQRIRLGGQGGQGSEGAAAGDLYLVVRIAPHPRYRVEGRDIYVELPLAPWEAALGTSVAIDTPGGEAKVKVPPGTSSGRRLRLRGRGLPNPRGTAGDLYAEASIKVPKTLTDQERRLFQELAAASDFDPRRSP